MFLRSGQRLRSVASPVRFIPPVQVVPGLSSGARGNHPYSGVEVTIVRTPPIRVMLWGPFLAVLAATQEGVHYFKYPDKRNGDLYSTLKNIEDYALKPFNNIEDHSTVLWNNAPRTLKGEIVQYMAKNGQVGADRWARITTFIRNFPESMDRVENARGNRFFMPEPTVPPEYFVDHQR